MPHPFVILVLLWAALIALLVAAWNVPDAPELADSIERLERSINELRAAQDALTATMEAGE